MTMSLPVFLLYVALLIYGNWLWVWLVLLFEVACVQSTMLRSTVLYCRKLRFDHKE